MHAIDTQGSVNGTFQEGNPATGVRATRLGADWFNDVQGNLLYLLDVAGISPTKGREADVADAVAALIEAAVGEVVGGAPPDLDTLKKLADAFGDQESLATIAQVQSGGLVYAADTGPANGLVAMLAPAVPSLTTGMVVWIKVANTNTGAVTLNLCDLGATPVLWAGAPLAGGMALGGSIYGLAYDGAQWQLLNPTLSGIFAYADKFVAGTDTVTVPAWARHAEVQMIGGGGGGGGCVGPVAGGYAGGGGGAGGYSFGRIAVTPGAILARTVGAGGAGGAAGGAEGGTTSLAGFGSATGGGGGEGSTVTSAGGGGGSASNASMRNIQGATGGDGNSTSPATQGGYGASGAFGGGGRTGAGGGEAGRTPGSGGGGAWVNSGLGGNGADGAVLIMFMA